ncbi:MAG: RyR domain-containing protein [Pseudomonadota bacterium]
MNRENASSPEKIEKIARTAHDAIRGWRLANGQEEIPEWADAPDWMLAATKESVSAVLKNLGMSASAQHDQWVAAKKRDGWKFGHTKDPIAKTHPLLIPFDQLPEVERMKDTLINAIVAALASIGD